MRQSVDHFHSSPVDDSATCFHGSGVFEDCNSRLWMRNLMIRYHGNNCRWWHFYPDETTYDLKQKFEEIFAGKQEDGLLNGLARGAKGMQKKWFGKIII